MSYLPLLLLSLPSDVLFYFGEVVVSFPLKRTLQDRITFKFTANSQLIFAKKRLVVE